MLLTYQILSSKVMGTQVDIGEVPELHVPRACSLPAWLQGWLRIPTPGRREIINYHQAGGAHELEPQVFL